MEDCEIKYEWDESEQVCVAKAVNKKGEIVQSVKADISVKDSFSIDFYNQSDRFSKENVQNLLEELLRIRLNNQHS